jgi:predicted RNA-binding protein with PUA-like domain
MKSEPDEFSIDDLGNAPARRRPGSGVRNYQARNFMRDEMRSATACSSITRAARSRASRHREGRERAVSRRHAVRPKSTYYDAKSKRESRAGCSWT